MDKVLDNAYYKTLPPPHDKMRELYGVQIDRVIQSLWARIEQQLGRVSEIPEGGYHGAYLVELAEERRKGNCTERVMRATAPSYFISPAALGKLGLSTGEARVLVEKALVMQPDHLRAVEVLRRDRDADEAEAQLARMRGMLFGYSERFKHVIGPEVSWMYRTRVEDFNSIPKFDGDDYFLGTNEFGSSPANWRSYFGAYGMAVALQRQIASP